MESLREELELITDNQHLTEEEASSALKKIIDGKISPSQIAAFLTSMRQKGETVEELTAFVQVMRDAAIKVDVDVTGAVDLCGTGGDASGTFNISTAAMFVVAGAGVHVLKHGNRSVSSKSGSADVLGALGVAYDLPATDVETCFNQTGMAFMFAPLFHPAMKYVMPVRRELGLRTFFNILGPLMNPAGVKRQVMGAYSQEVAETAMGILANLDTEDAITVYSRDGLDEFSTTDTSVFYRYMGDGDYSGLTHKASESGFRVANLSDLQGGDAQTNARIIQNILDNKATIPQREIVVLNAAYGILVSGKVFTLDEAIAIASDSINSGNAALALEKLITCTQDLKKGE